MKTKKISTPKVKSKTIVARDMVEDMHVFAEKLNLAIAQDKSFGLDSKVKYTQVKFGRGTSHLFEMGDHCISIDFTTNTKGGLR